MNHWQVVITVERTSDQGARQQRLTQALLCCLSTSTRILYLPAEGPAHHAAQASGPQAPSGGQDQQGNAYADSDDHFTALLNEFSQRVLTTIL